MKCDVCGAEPHVLLVGKDGRQIVRCSDKDHTILSWGDFYKGYTVIPRIKMVEVKT